MSSKANPIPGTHFMLDIETTDVGARANVLSIACIPFNPYGDNRTDRFKNTPKFHVFLKEQPGRVIDHDTIMWWFQQEDEVRMNQVTAERIDPRQACEELATFIRKHTVEGTSPRIWAKSPAFDCAILINLYSDYSMRVPWGFWNELDVRTILNFFPTTETVAYGSFVAGQLHEAIYDVQIQALQVQTALRGSPVKALAPTNETATA